MKDKMLAVSYVWGLRVGAALALLVGLVNVGVGVYAHHPSPILLGLGFTVAALAEFLTSRMTRKRLTIYIVVQVVLAAIMGFFFFVAVVRS